jgi:hypothetical protein
MQQPSATDHTLLLWVLASMKLCRAHHHSHPARHRAPDSFGGPVPLFMRPGALLPAVHGNRPDKVAPVGHQNATRNGAAGQRIRNIAAAAAAGAVCCPVQAGLGQQPWGVATAAAVGILCTHSQQQPAGAADGWLWFVGRSVGTRLPSRPAAAPPALTYGAKPEPPQLCRHRLRCQLLPSFEGLETKDSCRCFTSSPAVPVSAGKPLHNLG